MIGKKGDQKLSRIKRIIVLALSFMMIGTLLELYLLDHFEDTLQLIPIIGIGAGLILMPLVYFSYSQITVKLYQLILIALSVSGFYGVFLHLKGNFEFEQEMKPTASSWELFVDSLSGAFPALAPLSLVVLALLGYSYLILINQKK